MGNDREDISSFPPKLGTPGTLYDPIQAPDNFTHPSLFDELQINPYPFSWTFADIMLKTSRPLYQFTAVCIFHVIYYHYVLDRIEPDTILECVFGSTIFFYIFGTVLAEIVTGNERNGILKHFRRDHFRLIATTVVFFYQLSPMLRSLTTEISTNTIQYIAGITSFLHICTSYYNVDSFMTSSTISINSGIIGSICLTSRLQTDYHCFVLLLLTVQIFVLFPVFGSLFWDSASSLILCTLLGTLVTWTVSLLTMYLYLGAMFLGVIVIPCIMFYGLKYKHNIYGPWDEAIIEPYIKPNRIKPLDPYC